MSNYDRTQPLTIDPVLNYVTYLGGSGTLGDQAFGIALDAAGDAYVAGITLQLIFRHRIRSRRRLPQTPLR